MGWECGMERDAGRQDGDKQADARRAGWGMCALDGIGLDTGETMFERGGMQCFH